MTMHTKASNAWKTVRYVYAKVSGSWQNVGQIYCKSGGTWYPVWSYSWTTGSYGSCSADCGGGTQTRSVTCTRNDGYTMDDSLCVKYVGSKPATSQSCNTQECEECHDYHSGSVSWGGHLIQDDCGYCRGGSTYTNCAPPCDGSMNIYWEGKVVGEFYWDSGTAHTSFDADGYHYYGYNCYNVDGGVSQGEQDTRTCMVYYGVCRTPIT